MPGRVDKLGRIRPARVRWQSVPVEKFYTARTGAFYLCPYCGATVSSVGGAGGYSRIAGHVRRKHAAQLAAEGLRNGDDIG